MNKYIFIINFLLLTYITSAQTIVTDRPDQTESSSTVPKSSFQIETGILVGFSDKDCFSERQLLLPSTLFRIAMAKGVELRVVSQIESNKNKTLNQFSSGISDLEVGVKIQILNKESTNTGIAFLSHLILPTGSEAIITSNKFGVVNKLSISYLLNNTINIGYNAGYNYLAIGNGDLTYSLSLGISITDKLGVYVEPYGEYINFKEHTINFDTGFNYLIKDNFQIDFSFGIGINNIINYMAFGCSWNIRKSINHN